MSGRAWADDVAENRAHFLSIGGRGGGCTEGEKGRLYILAGNEGRGGVFDTFDEIQEFQIQITSGGRRGRRKKKQKKKKRKAI